VKFSTKLLLIILGVLAVSMTAVFTVSFNDLLDVSKYAQEINAELGVYASVNSKEELINQAESYLARLSKSQADGCNEALARIQSHVVAMAGYMENLYRNSGNFTGRKLPLPNEATGGLPTATIMTANDVKITAEIEKEMLLISNAEYMFANIFAADPYLELVYLGTRTGIHFRYTQSNAYEHGYDPRKRPWYIIAYNADGPVWTDTYISSFNNELCISCAAAYKDSEGKVAGVAAADILLSRVVSNIINLRIGETGYAFLLDNSGNYIAHPHYDEIDTNALDTAHGDYKDVLTVMAAGESSVCKTSIDGTDYYIAHAPLSVTGWSLGIAVEYDEIISGALNMKTDIDSKALAANEHIRKNLNIVMLKFVLSSCFIIIVVLIISVFISQSVTRPIIRLTKGVIEVGKGNLDSKIDIQSKDEIGILADSFNKMTDDLKSHIENLSNVMAEKERINSDLRIATDIQADMLPKIFPPYSDRDDLHIAAFMQPAKEVGGDFYDFFFLDDSHTKIALVIADVSGKGVPAALFMVIAKILIKNNKDLPPQRVLEEVNNLLCADNNSSMFVTTYYSILDIPTGKYTFVSAGHNPPVLYRKNNNVVSYLSLPRTPPLAIFPNKKFVSQEITLEKGDALLLYTDGVTEAFNSRSEMYGTGRLLENIAKLTKEPVEQPAEKVVNGLYETIREFAGEEPQSDDITMLFCKYIGTT